MDVIRYTSLLMLSLSAFYILVNAPILVVLYFLAALPLFAVLLATLFMLRVSTLKNVHKQIIFSVIAIITLSPVLADAASAGFTFVPNGLVLYFGIKSNDFSIYNASLAIFTDTIPNLQKISLYMLSIISINLTCIYTTSKLFKEKETSEPPQELELPGGDL